MIHQILYPVEIIAESRTDVFFDQLTQFRICVHQPSARRNAVGLVVEFLRIDLIEITERIVLDDVAVDFCNAVHRERSDYGQICHTDVSFMYDTDGIDEIVLLSHFNQFAFKLTVDLFNDHVDSRKQFFDIFNRPFFKCFLHDGMVGIGKGVGYDVPGLGPWNMIGIHQDTHQFRNGESRMGIVELYHYFFSEIIQRSIYLHMVVDDGLKSGRNKEILLLNSEILTFFGCIVRIQVQADIVDIAQIFTIVSSFRQVIGRFGAPHS